MGHHVGYPTVVVNGKWQGLRYTAAIVRIAYVVCSMSRVDSRRHCEGACPIWASDCGNLHIKIN